MNRLQWIGLGVVALLALVGVAIAAPSPNNCGLNMLCRVRTLIVTGDATFSGDAGVSGSTTITGDATVGGTLGVTGTGTFSNNLTAHGTTRTSNIILDGGARLVLSGTGASSPYLASDGAGGVAGACGTTCNLTGNIAMTGNSSADGYMDPKTGIRNTGTAAACTATGAVCINDAAGVEVADGAGTTVFAVTAAGTITTNSAITKDCIALVAGTKTVTVVSGADCVVSSTTANHAYGSVSGTTLTVNGTGTDTVCYICL